MDMPDTLPLNLAPQINRVPRMLQERLRGQCLAELTAPGLDLPCEFPFVLPLPFDNHAVGQEIRAFDEVGCGLWKTRALLMQGKDPRVGIALEQLPRFRTRLREDGEIPG